MDRLRPVLLLDVDGVILDNERWEEESARLGGPALASLLGGDPGAWAAHQERVWQEVWRRGCQEFRGDAGLRGLNLSRWWDRVEAEWIAEVCAVVGVAAPETFEERVDVAERATVHILENTESVFPGAAEAIEELSGRFEIHMASGNPSFVVETVLRRLGVRDRVGRPFGSDLVGCQKGDSRFYPAILEAVEAVPSRAVVVDDGEEPLASARAAGLRTVKVGGAASNESDLAVGSLAELPEFISEVVELTETETA